MTLITQITKKFQKNGFFSENFLKNIKNQAFFSGNLLKNVKKRLFFSQNFDIFLQNPVSGPHKRHDGGWNCLIIQKKIVKFGQILSNLVEIQSNFVENLVKKLWISRAGQIWVNLLKNTKKGQNFDIFGCKIQFQVHLNATMAAKNF